MDCHLKRLLRQPRGFEGVLSTHSTCSKGSLGLQPDLPARGPLTNLTVGAQEQLAVNPVAIALAGILTLFIQRKLYQRRRVKHLHAAAALRRRAGTDQLPGRKSSASSYPSGTLFGSGERTSPPSVPGASSTGSRSSRFFTPTGCWAAVSGEAGFARP